MTELEEEDGLTDPNVKPPPRASVVCGMLSLEQEYFLLSLRFENPARSNKDYVRNLKTFYDVDISESSISNFFLRRFDHQGNYKKPNLVPVDKFKPVNRTRYYEFMAKVQQLSNHMRWKFFDEKHLANKDTLADKVRANPLTGQVDCIPVSGDFRQTYNLIAAITCNNKHSQAMVYTMAEENGTAECFMEFIHRLILSKWLTHGDVICLDNARIHTGGEAASLEDLFWNHEVDGRPLRIYVAFLPTRSPELNPIEFVFHILATRIRKLRTQTATGPCDHEVIRYASVVMNEMPFDLIARCSIHCGY